MRTHIFAAPLFLAVPEHQISAAMLWSCPCNRPEPADCLRLAPSDQPQQADSRSWNATGRSVELSFCSSLHMREPRRQGPQWYLALMCCGRSSSACDRAMYGDGWQPSDSTQARQRQQLWAGKAAQKRLLTCGACCNRSSGTHGALPQASHEASPFTAMLLGHAEDCCAVLLALASWL